jgi:hypothetical protein
MVELRGFELHNFEKKKKVSATTQSIKESAY